MDNFFIGSLKKTRKTSKLSLSHDRQLLLWSSKKFPKVTLEYLLHRNAQYFLRYKFHKMSTNSLIKRQKNFIVLLYVYTLKKKSLENRTLVFPNDSSR